MKFLDLFSGIGGFRLGMEMAGHECVGHCEIDKYADKSYRAMHNPKESEWYGSDITRVRADELPRADIWCFGAPCQDFSIAGNREGLDGERSSLVREVFRLVRELKEEHRPKYLIYENVKGMLSSNKGFDFLEILVEMESLGYDRIEYCLLNSKDFGVPQNRERVYVIGHLRGRSRTKVFPIKWDNNRNRINVVGKLDIKGDDYIKRVYSPEGISPCLPTCQGGSQEPKIIIDKEYHYVIKKYKEFKSKNGYIPEFFNPYNCYEVKDIAPCLTAQGASVTKSSTVLKKEGSLVRKLTPREFFRLQGFPDTYFEKAAAVNSDSQLYKQAGNSVSVPVIYEIARRLA